MDLISSFILLTIVIILVILCVTWPLSSRHHPEVEGNQIFSSLMAEHDRILNSLKELDFDNSLGKIPIETYTEQRANLLQKGVEILRKIDDLGSVLEAVPNNDAGPEDKVETFLTARRARQVAGPGSGDDEVESLVARRRRIHSGRSGKYCDNCGRPLSNTDRFCPACGHPVQ